MDNSVRPLWIMGCGDIGRRLAVLYQKQNRVANVMVCNKDSADANQAQGLNVIQCDLDEPNSNEALSEHFTRLNNSDVFYFIPPPRQGLHDNRLRRFLATVAHRPHKIVLISTTGVYGDCQGEWIDESQPVKPGTERAHRRLDAEQAVIDWANQHKRSYCILRVAGIYAKDRLPLSRLKQGVPMVEEKDSPWTNRIHADDLAAICQQAMDQQTAHRLYNVCDGEPSTMTHYFDCVAEYAGLPYPPKISLDEAKHTLSAGMLSYLGESRRIRNTRLLDDLSIDLQYSSLKQALAVFKQV